jgi:hypothetical protein
METLKEAGLAGLKPAWHAAGRRIIVTGKPK